MIVMDRIDYNLKPNGEIAFKQKIYYKYLRIIKKCKIMNNQIKNRRDLFDFFEENILHTYENLTDGQELDYSQNLLKTQIIETNINVNLFKKKYSIKKFSKISNNLAELVIGKNNSVMFLDSSDSRFWLFYSLEKSNVFNNEIEKLMNRVNSGLDYTWIPINMQRDFRKLGKFRGLGTTYKPKEVFSEKYVEDNLSFGDLSIKSWGRGSEKLYNILEKNKETKKFLSLSSIGIKKTVADDFVLEDIGYNGNFTTRGGNSIQLHLDILDHINNEYSTLLKTIEDGCLSYQTNDTGTKIYGDCIIINLQNRINNIEEFISNVISSKKPFMLWGLQTKLEKDYYKVKGIDLHNGDKYTMEISPDWIRLYLDKSACGNTALRILVNIQHYYDSGASLAM